MARYNAEIPYELLSQFEELQNENMMQEMVKEGAKIVFNNIKKNMQKSFKSTETLDNALKITRVYKTPSDDGINVHIGFYGYDPRKKTKRHPKGIPIPLKALAREYGTSRGETKKPFMRKSFKKAEIEAAMLKIQDKYIKGD